MDAAALSRMQTGISLGVHFIFPSLTLGLTLFILIVEVLHVRTGKALYRDISKLAVNLTGLVFAFGVATGITLPIAFGTNWSAFSAMAGPLFGTSLAIEAIVAFMMEAVFSGILLFGRDRAGKGLYLFSAFMVFLGAHLSAFIIVAANSWMQTPFHTVEALNQYMSAGIVDPALNGFTIENGKIILTDYAKVFFTPTMVKRFLHTVTAAWLSGGSLMLGAGAYYLRKGRKPATAKSMMGIALVICTVGSVVQPLWGHNQIMEVIRWQGPKSPAMEGIFRTQTGAPLYGFGFVDIEGEKTYGLGIPGGLSFLETGDFSAESRGLSEFPKELWPPVQTVFQSFHFMVLIGVLLIALFIATALLRKKNKLESNPIFLALLTAAIPLPVIANDLGWVTAELGRQPWTIYGILRTKDAASGVPPGYVLGSLLLLVALYAVLLGLFFKFLPRLIRNGLGEK